jgi:integrase/recombinase XerD
LAVDRLRACLNWCVRVDLIPQNPIARLPRLRENEATARYKRRALSESEIVRLLTASENDDQLNATRRSQGQTYRGDRRVPRVPQTPLWRALLETGARWGELTRSTWADVDLHGRVLTLRAQNTKAGKARSIPLLDGLLRDLVRLRALHAQVHGRPAEPDDRVFLAPAGVPWGRPTTNPMRIFDRVLERAGIPRMDAQGKKLDLHAMRTTCGTRMARHGANIVSTQRLLGHSSITLTEKHYVALGLEDVRAAMQAVPTGSPLKDVS